MKELIVKLGKILSRSDRRRFAWLFVAFVMVSLLEVAGIASVMPFMELVSRPEVIRDNEWMAWAYERFGFTSHSSFLIAAGVIVLLLIATSNAAGLAVLWLQQKVAWGVIAGLHERLMRTYLYQPYQFFLRINSAEIQKQLLSEVGVLANRALLPALHLVSSALISVVILALLMSIDPGLATTAFVVLGGAYGVVYFALRGYLTKTGEARYGANRKLFRSASEAFSDVKSVKATGTESFFLGRFRNASNRLAGIQPRYRTAMAAPGFLMRTISFGGIVLIVIYLLAREQGLERAIPVLSVYAMAGYRLLPALQSVFASVGDLQFNLPVVESIYQDLALETSGEPSETPGEQTLGFDTEIMIDDVSFMYDGSETEVLAGISMSIPKGAHVAFVGSTGSGKSTLADILCGLIIPTRGQVRIDGQPLSSENVRGWQRRIGYVTQDVTLLDDSVMRNIAFAVPIRDIDMRRVEEACRIAGLDEFVRSQLVLGFETHVGERGVRLSGGQGQRIGLARALYSKPEVLVLDEATSALDQATEFSVLRAVALACESTTIVTITHRLASVRDCDVIYLIEGGNVVASGAYDDLIGESQEFRRLARADESIEITLT